MLWLQLFDSFTLSDDLAYHFVWQKDEGQALQVIRNFNDLINSQLVHYQISGNLYSNTWNTLFQYLEYFVPIPGILCSNAWNILFQVLELFFCIIVVRIIYDSFCLLIIRTADIFVTFVYCCMDMCYFK